MRIHLNSRETELLEAIVAQIGKTRYAYLRAAVLRQMEEDLAVIPGLAEVARRAENLKKELEAVEAKKSELLAKQATVLANRPKPPEKSPVNAIVALYNGGKLVDARAVFASLEEHVRGNVIRQLKSIHPVVGKQIAEYLSPSDVPTSASRSFLGKEGKKEGVGTGTGTPTPAHSIPTPSESPNPVGATIDPEMRRQPLGTPIVPMLAEVIEKDKELVLARMAQIGGVAILEDLTRAFEEKGKSKADTVRTVAILLRERRIEAPHDVDGIWRIVEADESRPHRGERRGSFRHDGEDDESGANLLMPRPEDSAERARLEGDDESWGKTTR